MNKDNAKDFLPLVQALADGKVIQARMFSCDSWKDCARPDFTMDASSYRIKPEPREVWVNHYPRASNAGGPYRTKEEAEFHAGEGATQVRYREVIE